MRKRLFTMAMEVARKRRQALDAHRWPSIVENLEWIGADRLVLTKIKNAFGGRLRYCLTGGSALSKDIQTFFADIGIPVLEVKRRKKKGAFFFQKC